MRQSSGRPLLAQGAAAFEHMRPAERLKYVETALQTEAASRRRRRRLSRAAKPNPLAWLIVLAAAFVCGAVGIWNYHLSTDMLHQLGAQYGSAFASASPPVAASVPWSWERLQEAGAYLMREALEGPPPTALPDSGSGRATLLSLHGERYRSYQTLGLFLVGLGSIALLSSLAMVVARRE